MACHFTSGLEGKCANCICCCNFTRGMADNRCWDYAESPQELNKTKLQSCTQWLAKLRMVDSLMFLYSVCCYHIPNGQQSYSKIQDEREGISPCSDQVAPRAWNTASALSNTDLKAGYTSKSSPIPAYCAPWPVKTKARPTSLEERINGNLGGRHAELAFRTAKDRQVKALRFTARV